MTGSPPSAAQRLAVVAWYAAGVTMLLALPSQFWGHDVVWMLPRARFLEALIAPTLYAGGAVVLFVMGWRSRPSVLVRLVVVSVVVAATFGVMLDQGAAATRDQLIFMTALCAVFLLGPPHRKYQRTAAAIMAVVGAVTILIVAAMTREESMGRQVVLHTGYHVVEVTYHPRLARSITEGGGIAPLAGGYLVVPGDGALYYLQWEGDRLQSRRLELRVPLERERFRAEAPAGVDARLFRVGDVFVKSEGDDVTVFVSHHAWHPEESCFTLRVSYITTSVDALIRDSVTDTWRILLDTQPCLPFKDRSFAFAGLQNGGRMALLDERTLLLTVGDHEFDGIYSDAALPRLPDNDYGKTLLISLDVGARQVFTRGHRNPQGLRVARSGDIWLTEHGPAGGDELNRLVRGGDYGWPLHTYGVDYEEGSRPVPEPDPESGIVMPERAWIPSIGISNLIDLRGTQFEHWAGDLLIGSLRAETLYRVHLRAGTIAYIERIPIGERIRDLIEDESGRIVLWTDSGSLVSLQSTALAPAEVALRQCLACHALDQQHGIGPGLAGIVGRAIAGAEGYVYSESLKSLGGDWTIERLDSFLENPSKYAPGNKMVFAGVTDAQTRAALVELLKRQGYR